MMSLYCPLSARHCEALECDDISTLFDDLECACISNAELENIHDRIENNSDAIAAWRKDQYDQNKALYEDLSKRFAYLQSLINDNTIRIADTNFRIDQFGLALGNAIKDLYNLESYTKDFLKDVIDRHTVHINQLHKETFENAGDIDNLEMRSDNFLELFLKLNQNTNNNRIDIDKILAALFSNGIYIEGVTDIDKLPDFGGSSEGPCSDCANKSENNTFLGDNIFNGRLELINRDFVIRHPYDKGKKPDKQSHLDVQWKDKEGTLTSDNISSIASMIEPNGDVKTALRSYRYVNGSIEHCDIILTTPPTGESYVELSNLKVGTQYNEYQCGTGWLETWDWIHGHTTLEIDGSVDLNVKGGDTHIYGSTQIDQNLTVDQDVYLNNTGGTTVIYGDTHIHNTFEVDGDSHFHSNVTVNKNVHVDGGITADGVVEGNHGALITGPGENLMFIPGYDCQGAGPQNLFEIHNGKPITLSLIYGLKTCYTAAFFGGMRIHELNNMAAGMRVDGYVDIKDHLCIGHGGQAFNETHYAQIINGSLLLRPRSEQDSEIGKPKDEFDGSANISGFILNGGPVCLNGGKGYLGCKNGQNLQQSTAQSDEATWNYTTNRFNGHVSVVSFGCEGTCSIGYGPIAGALDVNGNARCDNLDTNTINGRHVCYCDASGRNSINKMLRKTDLDYFTYIANLDELNIASGIVRHDGGSAEIYEDVIELPFDFLPNMWSVQATYNVSRAVNKEHLKQMVPLTVEIEQGSTRKFKVYGNVYGYTWTASGNTDWGDEPAEEQI